MTVRPNEKGTALLTVLLLVAVMATIAATALDRISVGTRLIANAATVGQARAWLETAELIAATRIEDLLAADQSQTTLAGGWMGVERAITLPDGALVRVRVEDGGNCFNLNSLVELRQDRKLAARPFAQAQFRALMVLVGIPEGEAVQIAASATDYIDSDSIPSASGAEDRVGAVLAANKMMADASELRAVAGVADRHYSVLKPWLCALPTTDLSPLNVNTLAPEQAPLLAMILPGKLDAARAKAQIAARPEGGYGSVLRFWESPILAGLEPPPEAGAQLKVRTTFFRLQARVDSGDIEVDETALIDATRLPARVIRRSFGQAG